MKLFPMSLAVALALSGPLQADEVSDALTAAQAAYAAGDLNGTAAQLITASKGIQQQQWVKLSSFLPEAPAAWTREVSENSGDAMAMMGMGGVMAEARYIAPDGNSFSLTMAADNPMVMSMAGMLTNAQMMAMMGKIVKIGGQDMLDQQGSLAGLVGMRVLVQANGMDTAEMVKVLETMDFAGLATFDK